MSLQHLAFFVAAALLLCLSPGPDILTVITRSIAQGTRAGLVATLGFASGLIFHTTAAALGLALVLRNSPTAFHIVKYFGAAYLLHLAIRMVLARNAPFNSTAGDKRQLRAIYGQSVLMNLLNPKVTVFFLAFLSGFAEPEAAFPAAVQMIVYGAIFALCTLVTFGTCALAAGTLAGALRRKPQMLRWTHWLAACVFVLLAAWLALE